MAPVHIPSNSDNSLTMYYLVGQGLGMADSNLCTNSGLSWQILPQQKSIGWASLTIMFLYLGPQLISENKLLRVSQAYTILMQQCTFFIEIKQSLSKEQALDQHLPKCNLDPGPVIELDVVRPLVVAFHTLQPELDLRLDQPVHLEAPPLEEIGTDGRVVADLLQVDRASADPQLNGLPEDGVEWFVQADPERPHRDSHQCCKLDSLQVIMQSFQKESCKAQSLGNRVQMRLFLEYLDRETNVHDVASMQQFVPKTGDNVLEDPLLFADDLLVGAYHSSVFPSEPLFEQIMLSHQIRFDVIVVHRLQFKLLLEIPFSNVFIDKLKFLNLGDFHTFLWGLRLFICLHKLAVLRLLSQYSLKLICHHFLIVLYAESLHLLCSHLPFYHLLEFLQKIDDEVAGDDC